MASKSQPETDGPSSSKGSHTVGVAMIVWAVRFLGSSYQGMQESGTELAKKIEESQQNNK